VEAVVRCQVDHVLVERLGEPPRFRDPADGRSGRYRREVDVVDDVRIVELGEEVEAPRLERVGLREVADAERLDGACVQRAGSQEDVVDLVGELRREVRLLLGAGEPPNRSAEEHLDMRRAAVLHTGERFSRPAFHLRTGRPAAPHAGAQSALEG
jgi:hypothetical protein